MSANPHAYFSAKYSADLTASCKAFCYTNRSTQLRPICAANHSTIYAANKPTIHAA